ncbi:MAG: hypothetical protein A2Y17_09545 [Clostridiales bacterium GWF2_38_85]|nr:MAG: hypothetical protein A2Y17_09545 [Clostridiales bacterium GWF2_38_85]HBL83559.1 hypothetical protein [Clostridiales bacterium]
MEIKFNLKRYENSIVGIEKYPIEKGKILLCGSSFFTNWGYERSREQLSGIGGEQKAIINHGFGGSTVDEVLYYYHRLIKPYDPKMIVTRFGINDIFAGYSIDQICDLSSRFYEWAKTDFPNIKIIILSSFDFKSAPSKNVLPQIAEYNDLMKKYCAENNSMFFCDINEFFYKSKNDIGTFVNFKDIFKDDGLHLTDEGYDQLAHYFKEKLSQYI